MAKPLAGPTRLAAPSGISVDVADGSLGTLGVVGTTTVVPFDDGGANVTLGLKVEVMSAVAVAVLFLAVGTADELLDLVVVVSGA